MPVEDGIKSKLSVHSSGNNENKLVEKINISIGKCKNLVSFSIIFVFILRKKRNDLKFFQSTQKPEGLTIYAKLEFNEGQIGESQKITITPGDSVPDLNFIASLNVNTNDQVCMDDLSYKPVIGLYL